MELWDQTIHFPEVHPVQPFRLQLYTFHTLCCATSPILATFSYQYFSEHWCMCAKLLQSFVCNPMDYSPPGSSIHGILQARILDCVAMPSSRGSSQARDQNCVSYISCFVSWVPYYQRHLESPILYNSSSLIYIIAWDSPYEQNTLYTVDNV